MDSIRKTSIIVGLLFIIATVSTLLTILGFWPIYEADYLTLVAANEISMLVAVFLFLILAASAVGISIAIMPMDIFLVLLGFGLDSILRLIALLPLIGYLPFEGIMGIWFMVKGLKNYDSTN